MEEKNDGDNDDEDTDDEDRKNKPPQLEPGERIITTIEFVIMSEVRTTQTIQNEIMPRFWELMEDDPLDIWEVTFGHAQWGVRIFGILTTRHSIRDRRLNVARAMRFDPRDWDRRRITDYNEGFIAEFDDLM